MNKEEPPNVSGFSFGAVASGIKKSGDRDLGLILADSKAISAGVFTQNRVRAAPVLLAEERLGRSKTRAVLVNSGNANACTGKEGLGVAKTTTRELAKLLGEKPKSVLPASTGVIGVQLPQAPIVAALPKLISSAYSEGVADFAKAIMTTDRFPKVSYQQYKQFRVLGVAKGAGMIHPNMATTLGFVVTDANVSQQYLSDCLKECIDGTFNRITVDGDTSTNDAVIAMSSQVQEQRCKKNTKLGKRFKDALHQVLMELAHAVVSDGEGAEHVARVEVSGLSKRKSLNVARTIATSSLVKTAMHGCDPNWGRILAAAGRAGVEFDESAVRICIGKVPVYEKGKPVMTEESEKRASLVMKGAQYTISFEVGEGRKSKHAYYYTSDLGHAYVRLNADYRS